MKNKSIEKSIEDKKKLAIEYDVPISSIVWMGDNHYIVIKHEKEIMI